MAGIKWITTSRKFLLTVIVLLLLDECTHAFLITTYNNNKRISHRNNQQQQQQQQQSKTIRQSTHLNEAKARSVVIIGGGWAGYTAAEELSRYNEQQGGAALNITLLDASKSAGGLAGGYRTPKGRPVDAGIHGFWREYLNTFEIMRGIDGVEIDDVLTDYIPSMLVSKSGRVAVAPVVGGDNDATSMVGKGENKNAGSIINYVASLLPPPLDLAILADIDSSSPLTPLDRISGIGLLGAWSDFEQESEDSWKIYDKFSAEELFKKYAGISDTLYDELVSPLLHVLPMAPGYDCSAAAALSCFHVFALQSKGAFDVRWGRGSLSELIFNPWAKQLERRNVAIRGGSRVSSITSDDSAPADSKVIVSIDGAAEEPISCDAIVLAIGATSCAKLVSTSPFLSQLPATQNFESLRGVTCVAVRLFLEPSKITSAGVRGGKSTQLPPDVANAMSESPAIVCGPDIGGIPELKETGFCIYDLQRMHDEFSVPAVNAQDNDGNAVIEIDFYRADSFVDMNDEEIIELSIKAIAAALDVEPLNSASVVDSAVLRARKAVSHFAVGSASCSPQVTLDEKAVYICGDWIDRSGHASWSTEKAVVTGKQAVNALLTDFGLNNGEIDVLPAPEDTSQLKSLRELARTLRRVTPPPVNDGGIPPSPWMLAEKILGR